VDAGFTQKVRGVISRKVQLSVDAVDEKVSKRILNVSRPRIERAVETCENFLYYGITPKIKAVITAINVDQPKAIVDLFYGHGAREFHFVRYRRTFHRHTDELFLGPECTAALRDQFDEIRAQHSDAVVIENLSQSSADIEAPLPKRAREIWNGRLGCGGGWSALGIAPDGRVFLCEQMKMSEPFFVGDASSQSIPEIWHGEQMLRFIYPDRAQFTGTACYECEEFEKCIWEKGRCYRDAYFSYGSIYHPPPLCPSNPLPGLRVS
jgi:radical SAM protein with 4Fe4S-binding SPASM domain